MSDISLIFCHFIRIVEVYWVMFLHPAREVSAIWSRRCTGIIVFLILKRALRISYISNASSIFWMKWRFSSEIVNRIFPRVFLLAVDHVFQIVDWRYVAILKTKAVSYSPNIYIGTTDFINSLSRILLIFSLSKTDKIFVRHSL